MSLWQDLRYGARQLRLSPGFTAVAVLSLGLGIGANTAIFQLVDAVRLRTLPVSHPEQLATIGFQRGAQRSGQFSTRSAEFTYGHYEQIAAQQQGFDGFAVWSATQFNLATGGEVRYAEGLFVNGDFYQTLGVVPALGRVLRKQDDRPGCGIGGAVLSYAFWQREFGGAMNVLQQTVSLDGHAFPIVGVSAPSFFGVEVGRRYDVAVPLCTDPVFSEDGKGRIPVAHDWWLSMMGRLKPGWSVERATSQLAAISPGIMQATVPSRARPESVKRYLANKLEARPAATGVSELRQQYTTPLWLLLATTGLVLLIACANLANLLLARASVRERELAIRLSMGASRAVLIRQLLAESLLLAGMGAAVGVALALAVSRGLVAYLSSGTDPVSLEVGMDLRALLFTAGLAVLTCLLFGLLPALQATRKDPASAMRGMGRGITAGRSRFSLRRGLVVTQVALSLVLLTGALLFVRSLHNLLTLDTGFQSGGVIAAQLDLRRPAYPTAQLPVVYRDLLDRLRAQPSVMSAALVDIVPVSGNQWNSLVRPQGKSTANSGKESFFNRVSPEYFRTIGTTLINGRDFTDRDAKQSTPVAIVNEAFAKKFFPGMNVVGESFRVETQFGERDVPYEIVGLVRNSKYADLHEAFRPIAYFASAQQQEPGLRCTIVVRTRESAGPTMKAITAAVGQVNPTIGIEYTVLAKAMDESLLRERLMATLSSAFGFLAALLSTLGLYGVISYMVAQRRNEIGVRVALGADRGRVIRLVLEEAGLLLVVGLVVGVGLSLWAGRTAEALLFGLQPNDMGTLAAAIGLLSVIALAASYGPARQAAALDPVSALRGD